MKVNFVSVTFIIIMLGSVVGFFSRVRSSQSVLRMSTAKEIVENAIKTNDIMVFSKTYCPYCTRAKDAIQSLNYKFTTIELDVSVYTSVLTVDWLT